jgi:hypothetical protein
VVAGFHTDFLPDIITLIVFGKLYLGVYGRIILKLIFKCWMGTWTGLIWLWTEAGGGLL